MDLASFRKYLMEFIGAFFLIGQISGGHYNPAVTLAVAIRGAMPKKDVIPYMAAQVLGGVGAALMVMEFKHGMAPVPAFSFRVHDLLLSEFIFTFALAFVVLHVATIKATANNSYYGLAIGGTVMAGAFAVGGTVCSGAFNPAVEVALACMKLTAWGNIYLTILANLAGGAAAGLVFFVLHGRDKE